MKHPFHARPILASNQSRHRRPAQGARPARKRFAGVILAGCIATLLVPQLEAGTVTVKKGNPGTSANYTTSKGAAGTLWINASAGQSFYMSGNISGNGAVEMLGPGTVTFTGSTKTFKGQTILPTGNLVLDVTDSSGNGIAAFNGFSNPGGLTPDILINGGTLTLGADNQLASNMFLQMTSGAFNMNGHSATIYNFANLGGNFSTGKGGNLTIVDPTWDAGAGSRQAGAGANDISNNTQVGQGTAGGQLFITGNYSTNVTYNAPVIGNAINVVNVIHGDEGSPGTAATLTVGSGSNPSDFLSISGTGIVMDISSDLTGAGKVVLNNADLVCSTVSGTASIISGPVLNGDGLGIATVPNGATVIQGQIDLGGSATRSFTVTNAAATLEIAPTLMNGGIVKAGLGTLTLTGDNTFGGPTVVNAGTLKAAGTGGNKALGATSGITVNSGGTLLMNTANQINATATMTLNGGTFNLGGVSQGSAGTAGVGALTLSATSTLDFGTTGSANSITFGGVGTHTAGTMLKITDYESGNHFYVMGMDSTAFTGLFGTNEISFNGQSGYGAISFGTYYEIVPVPEPATIVGAAGLLGFVGYRERKRVRGVWTSRIVPGLSFLGFLLFGGLAAVGKAVGLGGRKF